MLTHNSQFEASRLVPFPLAEEQFLNLLWGQPISGVEWSASTRLLTLFDESDRGKTSLLRRLRHRCQFPRDHASPVALIDFKAAKEKYSFCEQLQEQLFLFEPFRAAVEEVDAIRHGRPLLEEPSQPTGPRARLQSKQTAPNSKIPARRSAQIGLDSCQVSNSAVMAQVNVRGDLVLSTAPVSFTDDARQAEAARLRRLEHLAKCLEHAATHTPLVLLVDHWDDGTAEMREWAIESFLGPIALCSERRLFVVIVGKGLPPKFDYICEDWPRYVGTIPGIQKTWTPALFGQYLVLLGLIKEPYSLLEFQKILFETLLAKGSMGPEQMERWLREGDR